jgi:glycosyltransferase involved in cell wall biosynthesis
LQQIVSDNSAISSSIFFTGMLTGDAKWGAYYGCEAFALPSHQENFGIAVVEALACNKPVLISNQVNIWREIEAAGSGLVAHDTLEGTAFLLENWFNLTQPIKSAMTERSSAAYYDYFAVEPAARKLKQALQ